MPRPALPPVATKPPAAHEAPAPVAGEERHPTYVPPASPGKVRPARFEGHAWDDDERGRKVVALALKDDHGHDFGFGHRVGHVRREFVEEREFAEETLSRGARGGKRSAAAAEVPGYEPAETVADAVADGVICPPVAAAKSFYVVTAAAACERDAVVTPYVQPLDERRVMAYRPPAAAAAEYALAAPLLSAQPVPEPGGLVAVGLGAAITLLSRRARRSNRS
jgi:hypothetical protein